MGGNNSKPAPELSQHVFTADTPTRYSGGFVGALQDSTQSDTTRSALTELKIQSRVTSELERLANEEATKLKDLTSSTSQQQEEDGKPLSSETPTLMDRLAGDAAAKEKNAALSNSSVKKEIASLKEKLEKRKKVEAADPGVEKAKEALVQCLRINDRRPLDCWKEKEDFKREVGRLERAFVEKTVR
ncbi:putative altered inheritance of mitochondria protein 13, mitochondrial [Tothia fuscella]|uniref:Altered inheritance of mitochondria protein 13, mitochondrial n=1 Tax=Tothia fuscella TaxID=1048955 RepID=A0A9P4P046_9PEZI|nr:putative altered inheritance of mitochondria protein 13, mitochondrial [Tothia fuscella]